MGATADARLDEQQNPRRVAEARIAELEAAIEQAKKAICPYCAAGDPMSLDDDGVDRKGEYHAFYGGNHQCKAAFLQYVLPGARGQPLRSYHTMQVVRKQAVSA